MRELQSIYHFRATTEQPTRLGLHTLPLEVRQLQLHSRRQSSSLGKAGSVAALLHIQATLGVGTSLLAAPPVLSAHCSSFSMAAADPC